MLAAMAIIRLRKENAVKTTSKFMPFIYLIFGTSVLLVIYLLLMRVTTGSVSSALAQFRTYQYWILALAIGFGIQLGLYKYIKIKHMESKQVDNMAKITGTTSTATMVACCAHHAVDLVPILGFSALASFLGAYTKELFALGIISNLFGISVMLKQLRGFNNATV